LGAPIELIDIEELRSVAHNGTNIEVGIMGKGQGHYMKALV
jgi:hypothetical protein